jgi:hypothetical protein
MGADENDCERRGGDAVGDLHLSFLSVGCGSFNQTVAVATTVVRGDRSLIGFDWHCEELSARSWDVDFSG